MIPVLLAAATYVILCACEGRPKSLPKKESEPDIGVTHDKDGGILALDTFDAGDIFDAGAGDADAGDAVRTDAGDIFDAGAGVDDADAGDAGAGDAGGDLTDAGRFDAGIADAGDTFDAGAGDAGSNPAPGCQDLKVLLDEFSCVTDPQTISIFSNELPRNIKVMGLTQGNPDVVGCPSRDVLLHTDGQPLFISLMADRASIPALQSNPNATLSPFAEDFINTINGVHNLVPADGFMDGAVGVWRPEPNPGSGPFIFDAAIDGLNLIYGMPGYSCNYQVSSPW